jgi:hypothetical protein
MFDRAHHQRIAQLLLALNGDLFRANHCLFGGGTAIALRYGEYRESVDVDFLVSDRDSYRHLRQLARDAVNLQPFMRDGVKPFLLAREIRTDQYGIRTMVNVSNVPIKFEIILEARMELDSPSSDDILCGIPTLTQVDMAASKLLANSDRWLDAGVFSRDIIDLAMMKLPLASLRRAVVKAEQAYGKAILHDLDKAIARLAENQDVLDRCLQVMAVTLPKAVVWANIRKLRRIVPTYQNR